MASSHDSQLGDPALLAKMDKLRENGISEYIGLPQVRFQISIVDGFLIVYTSLLLLVINPVENPPS